jgi:hypothetical protein
MTQNEAVLCRLQRGPITSLEALTELGIMRLASRVDELRKQGHLITTETISRNNKNYARYHLTR